MPDELDLHMMTRLVLVVFFVGCPPMVLHHLLSGRDSLDVSPAEGKDFSPKTTPQEGRQPGEYPIYFRWEGHGGWLTAPFFIDLVAMEYVRNAAGEYVRNAAGEVRVRSYVLLEKVYVPKFEQDSAWSGTFTLEVTGAQKAMLEAKRHHVNLAPVLRVSADSPAVRVRLEELVGERKAVGHEQSPPRAEQRPRPVVACSESEPSPKSHP
jgi:hypothetical protein